MKKLIAIAVFLLALPAFGKGTCPPNPNEGIEGQIRCGHFNCGQLKQNSWYIGGGQCQEQTGFYCMVDCVPQLTTQEGATPMKWRIVYPNGKPFTGLENGRAVHLLANGQVVDRGKFVGGYVTFRHFGKFLLLAGDLFRMEEE